MYVVSVLISIILANLQLSIELPIDGESYPADWLPVRAVVENDDELPDSVCITLNGESVGLLQKLNTDWPTYMQSNLHHGFSESPAPMTNEVLWTAPVTSNFHEFPNPIVVDGVVYYPANMGDGKLHALNALTGEEFWTTYVGPSDDPPAYDQGLLFQASDSIFCIDALTGSIQWTFSDANHEGSTPCVFEDRLLVGTYKNWSDRTSQIYCLNKNDGKTIWDRELSGFVVSCTGVDQGVFFVPTWQGPLYAIDSFTGDVLWENNNSESGYWDSSPVIIDDSLWIGTQDGDVKCFNTETGNEIWSVFLDSTAITSTPAVYENLLIVGTQGLLGVQEGVVAALDRSDGSIVWSIANSIHGSFGLASGVVYWGTYTNPYPAVFAADALTGNIIWEYSMTTGPYGLCSTPSITDGIMYYAGADGLLYAFGTGYKYAYSGDVLTDLGSNELILTSFEEGTAVAADTVNFIIDGTGISLEPSLGFNLTTTPNPFTSSASIAFELAEPGDTSMQIFDLTGRAVTSLINQNLPQGEHSVQWNGCTDEGQLVSNGLYLCRIESGGVVESTSLCLLR